MRNEVVLILGMHRSGTSLMAHAVEAAGFALGEWARGRGPSNPKGFGEDSRFQELNKSLLKEMDIHWDSTCMIPRERFDRTSMTPYREVARKLISDRVTTHSQWTLKDPRISILLPFWLPLFEETGCSIRSIVCLRNPVDIAKSLKKRDDIPPEASFGLFCCYLLSIVRDLPGEALFMAYETMIDDPENSLRRIAGFLDVGEEERREEFSQFLTRFHDRTLQHHRSSYPLPPKVPLPVRDLYETLRKLSGSVASPYRGVNTPGGASPLEALYDEVSLCNQIQNLLRNSEEFNNSQVEQSLSALLEDSLTRVNAFLAEYNRAGERMSSQILDKHTLDRMQSYILYQKIIAQLMCA